MNLVFQEYFAVEKVVKFLHHNTFYRYPKKLQIAQKFQNILLPIPILFAKELEKKVEDISHSMNKALITSNIEFTGYFAKWQPKT